MKSHYRPIWYVAILLMVTALIYGCEAKDTALGDESCNIILEYSIDKYSAATKSILTSRDIEDKVTSLNLFIYYNDRLIHSCYLDGVSDGIPVTLETGCIYDIYTLVNMGDMTHVMPENKASAQLSEILWEIPSYSFIDENGLPMAGKAEGFKAGTDTPVIHMKRLFAKVTADIGFDYEGAKIKSVRIMNLNGMLKPFGTSYASASSSIMTEVESDAGSGSYVFYVPENMQGKIGSATVSHGKSPDYDPDIYGMKDVLTYMEAEVELDGQNGYVGSVTYRSYLGNNSTRNFDITGNSVYQWKVTYCQDNLQHNDWKIDTDSMLPAIKDILEFDRAMKAGPGQTAIIPFSYDLSGTRSEPSAIVFTADEGLYVGSATFTSTGEYSGTGFLNVTCSESTEIGDILTVRMNVGDIAAETFVEVVNYVTEIKLTAPGSTLYGKTMQFTATATYYDGTIITDPSEFIWVTEPILNNAYDIASIMNGLLARNLYKSGACKVWAEVDGVKSDFKIVSIPNMVAWIEFAPYPINITIGEKLGSGTIYFNYYYISDPEAVTSVACTSYYHGKAKFSVNDDSVASVKTTNSCTAEITGLKNGSTTLCIELTEAPGTDNEIFYMEVPVTVGGYSNALEVSPSKLLLNRNGGNTEQIRSYYVTYYEGQEISRTDVTSETKWSSTNTTVATVNGGYVNGITTGNCGIRASYKGYSRTINVEVAYFAYEFNLSRYSLTLDEGHTAQIYAYYHTYKNGIKVSTEDVTDHAYWGTANSELVEVDSGLIYAIDEGTALVYADYKGLTEYADVKINHIEGYSEEYIVITPSSPSVDIGESIQLDAMHYRVDEGIITSTTNIRSNGKWKSSNSDVATVSEEGLVTGISSGSATISISCYGTSASIQVNVGID